MTQAWWVVVPLTALLLLCCVMLALTLRRTRISLIRADSAKAAAVDAQHRTAELAVAAERIRIVREMHDVLAHSLAIMVAQADGGSYVVSDAEASRRAFLTIAETGRAALVDTRRILGVLRHGTDAAQGLMPADEQTSTTELVARAREAGLSVALVRTGRPRPLPAGSRMALFRICQEALTNVIKHAGESARTVVAERWSDGEVTLTITNEGGRPTSADDPLGGFGLGLIGMRERAELVGGSLTAAPTPGGFLVEVTLPHNAEPEEDPPPRKDTDE
ncbi:MAG: sensor histidine kinase [Propioniciclava sp.]